MLGRVEPVITICKKLVSYYSSAVHYIFTSRDLTSIKFRPNRETYATIIIFSRETAKPQQDDFWTSTDEGTLYTLCGV